MCFLSTTFPKASAHPTGYFLTSPQGKNSFYKFTGIRDGPLEKWWGGGGGWGKSQKKIHARENTKKKISCKEEGKEKKFMQKEGPIVIFI